MVGQVLAGRTWGELGSANRASAAGGRQSTESWASSAGVRRSMRSNQGRNTRLEVELRRALHRKGLRFWKHRRPLAMLRCEADVVFPRLKLAVFVNGCFWHGCPVHASWPVSHAEFWKGKLEGNQARDRWQDAQLAASGWTVLRLWEHQSLTEMTCEVEEAVARLRGSS